MQGDLHVHTYNSDGSQSAEQVVLLASRIGLDYISITDHDYMIYTDTLYDYAKTQGVHLIDGVELSTMDKLRNRRVHILCYLPKNRKLIEDICTSTTNLRISAGKQMAERVCKLYPITMEDIVQVAKNSTCIYKQHISKALMNAGYSTKIFSTLYDELFDFKNGSCIINFTQPDVYDIIDIIKKAGGICVMAHPYTYDSIELLDELAKKGLLDGVEVWSSKASTEQEQYLSSVADSYNLIKTGGSDFHGAYSSRISPLGNRYTPKQSIDALLELDKGR